MYMKKAVSLLLTIILALSVMLMFTGCGPDQVMVESVMDITADFEGTRTVTVKYPLSAVIDDIKDAVLADDPTSEVEGASFKYKGVEEDGYYFVLSFTFSDREEYEEQVSAVIGRRATSVLSVKDTVLTKGTRMTEDFGLRDLVTWMIRDTAMTDQKDLEFTESVNTVAIGSKTFNADPTIDISDVAGCIVNSVSIRTSNDKGDHYDRTFTFSVPNDAFVAFKDSFEEYFLSNTAPAAGYSGWSAEGGSMIYTVIYEKLSVDELAQYTSMLLDSDNIEIFYGDKDNSSTPLSEGLTFEESLDTLSFIGPDDGAPALYYSYSLPTNTIHGDGAVYRDGRWSSEGKWEDGVYKLELDTGSVTLRVPDGIQYAINGIDFTLESLGEERFRRTTTFLYNKTDGYDGMNYALSYFTRRGANASTGEDDENLTCSVVSEGTTAEITAELVKLFGSGNFMTCTRSAGAFALSEKTSFTDYISMGAMLNSNNENRPMRYYVRSSGGENIVSVSVDGSETAYTTAKDSVLSVKGGNATVEYRGNIPITSHIIIYILAGSLMLAVTVLIAALMLHRRKKPVRSHEAQELIDTIVPEEDDDGAAALRQTTTFSIFELGALSRNKKVVDEINRDVEKRMEADRIEEMKKEIRAKELEEMGRKVYGDSADKSDSSHEDESGSRGDEPIPDEPTPNETLPEADMSSKGDGYDA